MNAPGNQTPLDAYLAQLEDNAADTLRAVLASWRKGLPDTAVEMRHGIAMLCWNAEEIVGVSAGKGFFSLYVPYAGIVEKYTPLLGRVSAGTGCIHFKSLDEVNKDALRGLAAEAQEQCAAEAPTLPFEAVRAPEPGTAPPPAPGESTRIS